MITGSSGRNSFLQRAWLFIGFVLLVFVIWITLTPQTPRVLVILPHLDKAGHCLAYVALMAWFSAALKGPTSLARLMIAFIVIGGVLEILQGFTGRDPSWFDWFLDSIGVVVGAHWPRIWLSHVHDSLMTAHARRAR